MVVVSLETNDQRDQTALSNTRSNYRALLADLAGLTPRRAIAAIPPPEEGLEEAKKVSVAAIDSYNAILPGLAEEARVPFIPLPTMPERHTFDGIHLNATGYEVWDRAIVEGIGSRSVNSPKECHETFCQVQVVRSTPSTAFSSVDIAGMRRFAAFKLRACNPL